MITLRARGRAIGVASPILGRIKCRPESVTALERRHTVLVRGSSDSAGDVAGFAALVTSAREPTPKYSTGPAVVSCSVEHLADDDVVRISPSGQVETLYRRASPHNTILATERCNSYCVMCSQPPVDADDGWRVEENLALISLISRETRELGISGGEPTLLGQDLLRIVAACRDELPSTALHVLSNGRRFASFKYADAFGSLHHPDLMFGVPLYADVDTIHDYVVQARGAFNETVIGLQNLARANVPVEIRVVLHRDTVKRLPQLAQFIYRNFTFAAHVAFMGLEIVGFARAHLKRLWVDPADYQNALSEAVAFLDGMGMPVSIYNHQLCTLPESVWPFCRQAISDWKNEYAPECSNCRERTRCGGFFVWNLTEGRSRLLRAL